MRPALALVLLTLLSAAQTPAPKPPQDVISTNARIVAPPASYQFAAGTTYYYDVDWRLWHAGAATIKLDVASGEAHVGGLADSAGFVSLLYTVHDRFDSFFDPKTFCSHLITKNTEEGFRKRQTQIKFDNARGKAVLDEKDLKKGTSKHVENDVPACATDVIAGVFYVATLPLAANDIYTFPLNDGGKTVDVKVTVQAREKVKTPAGEFNTVRVQPESLVGLVKSRGQAWLWYTDDTARVPVQMRAKMAWGTITFRLARIEKK
jgi:hypothetical protein